MSFLAFDFLDKEAAIGPIIVHVSVIHDTDSNLGLSRLTLVYTSTSTSITQQAPQNNLHIFSVTQTMTT